MIDPNHPGYQFLANFFNSAYTAPGAAAASAAPAHNITQTDLDDARVALRSWNSDFRVMRWSSNLLACYAYQGLDVIRLLVVMGQRSNKAIQDVFADIFEMALVATARGTNIRTIKKKSTPALLRYISDWEAMYSLQANGTSADTVTLGRVVAAMPQYAVQAHLQGYGRCVLPSSQNHLNRYTRFLAAKELPAMIPATGWADQAEYELLCKASKGMARLTDAVLNTKKGNHMVEKDNIDRFWSIQHSSETLDAAMRTKWIAMYRICSLDSSTGQLSLLLTEVAAVYAKSWEDAPTSATPAAVRAEAVATPPAEMPPQTVIDDAVHEGINW